VPWQDKIFYVPCPLNIEIKSIIKMTIAGFTITARGFAKCIVQPKLSPFGGKILLSSLLY
jgi:hypothetical protein